MDTRPGHNQLMMMLKKRESFGENELYEMMKSRHVYQVQTELRKELERNVQALKRAEKLKVASFLAQREAFLRRVERSEKSKHNLVNVKAELGKFLSSPVLEENSEKCPERFERVFQSDMKPVGINTAQRVGLPAQYHRTAVKREESIQFPVHTLWMNKDVGTTPRKKISLTSEAAEKLNDHQISRGGGFRDYDLLQTAEHNTQKQGSPNSKKDRQKGLRLSSNGTNTNEDKSRPDTPNRLQIKLNQNVPKLSVTSEEDEQVDGNDVFSVEESNQDACGDPSLKPHISAGIEQHHSSKSNTQLKASRKRLQPLRLNCIGANQSNSLRLSPQDCLKINKAHAKSETTENQTSGEQPTSPSGGLVRAITMVFIEEHGDGDLSPKSLFDFEAWLAYNRRKKGYSRIVDDATRSTRDMAGQSDEEGVSKSDKKKLGGQVTLKLSKASPRNLRIHMGKTFREKSNEWYLAFLETRRVRNKSKASKENREVHSRLRDSALPEIRTLCSSPMVGIESNRNTMRRATKETRGQRLQKIREELRILEAKVHKFLYSDSW